MKRLIVRLIGLFFLIFLFQTCNDPMESLQNDGAFLKSAPGLEIAMEKVQDVVQLKGKVGNALFRNPLVVGHGVGLDENGKPAIIVYTIEKVDQRKDVNINNVGDGNYPLALPFEIEKVRVVPKVSGMFKAYDDPTSWFPRPVPIGVSVGHPDITAGTIGCRVTDGTNAYILSNNHVLANSNEAQIGDNILQPGPTDGGIEPNDVIGTLYDFEPISFSSDNTMDAAIAEVTMNDLGVTTYKDASGTDLTPSTTTVTAGIGMPVHKYGRTTGHTSGVIESVSGTFDICYKTRGPVRCIQSARFVNQIVITPGTFSGGGDSGSLIVTDDGNNKPVALLFAGSSTHTIASPIDPILARFGVTIDDGSGVVPPDPVHLTDIAITEIAATPVSASYGETVSIAVSVKNTGNVDVNEAMVVHLTEDGSLLTTWSVNGLVTGATTGLTFNWNTTLSDVGISTLEAILVNHTDDDPANDSKNTQVEIIEVSSSITLTATGYKVRGVRFVDLLWEGNNSTIGEEDIIITLDGNAFDLDPNKITITGNTAEINLGRVSGTFTFVVCETESNCSNVETVLF